MAVVLASTAVARGALLPGVSVGAWRVVFGTFVTLGLAYGFWYAYSVFLVALLREFGWSRSAVAGAFSLARTADGWRMTAPITSARGAPSISARQRTQNATPSWARRNSSTSWSSVKWRCLLAARSM